jgi:glucose-6-phosphate-specific signal transduction histidine kinase
VELAVIDDGIATPPQRLDGRGLADIMREATASGGSLRTTPPPGMTVAVTWPRRNTR